MSLSSVTAPGDLDRVVDGEQAAAALLDGDAVELDVIQRQRGIERDRARAPLPLRSASVAAGAGDLAGAGDIDGAAAAAAEIVDGAAVDGGARQRQGDAVVDLQRGAGIGHGVVEQRHRPGDLDRVVDGEQAAAALLDGDAVELDVIQRQRGIERDRTADAVAVEVGVGGR